jgi:hypothetical protein
MKVALPEAQYLPKKDLWPQKLPSSFSKTYIYGILQVVLMLRAETNNGLTGVRATVGNTIKIANGSWVFDSFQQRVDFLFKTKVCLVDPARIQITL